MNLADAVVELYGLPPSDFVPRRKALAGQLRGEDRELADRVAALPKPATAAWAVNHFARVRADDLGQLLDLGAQLREAQGKLDAARMRELSSQAHELVQGVVRDVAAAAAAAGTSLGGTVKGQVEQTLRAAIADGRAAEAARTGVLTKPLATGGFGPVDLEGAVAVEQAVAVEPALPRTRHLSVVRSAPPAATKRPPQRTAPIKQEPTQQAAAKDAAAEQARQHEVRLAAERVLDHLEQVRTELAARDAGLRSATEEHEAAQRRVEEAQDALDLARETATSAGRRERAARHDLEQAQRRERTALAAAERAKADLDELS